MKILSLECSASPASAAVTCDGRILASAYTHTGLTHSQTLLPMVEHVLDSCRLGIGELDGFAVSAGPGSFTGIRIGISAVKGLAAAKNLPCVSVSTLRAIAEGFRLCDCIVCAVMDARRSQVYNAIFDVSGGVVTRLCDDRALLCGELAGELKSNYDFGHKRIVIAGDGTDVFYPFVMDMPNAEPAAEPYRYQNAVCVGLAAMDNFNNGNTVPPDCLLPVYLRLPQAERELKMKNEGKI